VEEIPEEEKEEENEKKIFKKKRKPKQQQLTTAFPIAMTNLMGETLIALKAKGKLFKSLEEAEEAAKKIDAEMLKALEVNLLTH